MTFYCLELGKVPRNFARLIRILIRIRNFSRDKYSSTRVVKDSLNKAARVSDVVLALGDLEEYKKAEKRL
jgi:hypothetical protein